MTEVIDLDAKRREKAAKDKALLDDEKKRRLRNTADMNKSFCVVNDHGSVWIFQEVENPLRPGFRNIYRLTVPHFRLLFRNRKMRLAVPDQRDPELTKQVIRSAGDWWLDDPKRREFPKGAMFAPGQKLPAGVFNFWNGWSVVPVKPGHRASWELMQDHVYRVICSSERAWYEYLFNLLARMVQFPGERGQIATVLRGTEGVGKGIFVSYLLKIFGPYGLHLTNSLHLRGQYNAHLQNCILLFVDEAYWAGDREFEGALRGMITEEALAIEAKYQNLYEAVNCLHVIMSSNNDWVVPARLDDRRFFVLDVPDTRRNQKEYFEALLRERDHGGGPNAMLFDLLHRDVSCFDWRKIPDTPARRAQKRHSLDTITQYWMEALDRGYPYRSRYGIRSLSQWSQSGFYTKDLLWAGYLQWCDDVRRHQRQKIDELRDVLKRLYPETRPAAAHPTHEVERVLPGYGGHEHAVPSDQAELPYPSAADPAEDPAAEDPAGDPINLASEGRSKETAESDLIRRRPGSDRLADDAAGVVVLARRKRGFQVGSLEEAQDRFDAVFGPIDTPWSQA